jgi:hypothetical protein
MPQHDRSGWLPDDVIMRRLKIIRYSSRHERQARRAPSIRGVGLKAGIRKDHIFRLLSGSRRLTDNLRQRLSLVLGDQVEG